MKKIWKKEINYSKLYKNTFTQLNISLPNINEIHKISKNK